MSTPQYPEQPTTPLPHLDQDATPGQQGQTPPQTSAPQPPAYQPPQSYSSQAYGSQGYGSRSTAPIPTGTTLDKTNTFAFLSIIFAFLSPVAGIVFGHMGLSQIKRTGDSGRGIALTGLIISYAYFVLLALFIVVYIGFLFTIFAALGSSLSGFDSYSSY
ncbi:hypothetical protein GCM10009786_23060 [Leucobacter alluvii]|uniref:DUF4190 domain-containing protein n=1 Tax=Leucobacter alluvii TaxID=340321 RepID=A0ABP5MZ91_9MICO|nr:DUF4190 domain-containing protein [Leucobacter sp. L43]